MYARKVGKSRLLVLILAFATILSSFAAIPAQAVLVRPSASNLEAESAILIEQHSGEVLFGLNQNKRMQPASTTKIMTLLVALENGNLDDEVTVGSEINAIPSDSSRVPLIQGETLQLRDLLNGLILKSGNDAAVVIAKHISGSVPAFVEEMNRKAKGLGCTGTHFVNPHGYENKLHYSTAADMAKIAQAGMENEDFRSIVNTKSYTIPSNNKRMNATTLTTTNQFVKNASENGYAFGTGMKTGYFKNAQHTFVASASRGDVDLIAVVLKTTKLGKWNDAALLMDYGFASYGGFASIAPNLEEN